MMKIKTILCMAFATILVFSVFGKVSVAEDYPSRAIKLIVPFNPGGSTDTSARIFAKYLSKYLSCDVGVVNVSGAAGSVGTLQVYNAKPDGYTLLWNHTTLLSTYHTGVSKFTWDAMTPVCQIAKFFMVLEVNSQSPWKSVEDLIKSAKENPNKIKWGVNIGAGLHFIALGFQLATDTRYQFFAGGGDRSQAVALLGNHIDVATPSEITSRQYLQTGKLRALAVTGNEREKTLPDVPTLKELGINYSFEYEPSLFGPPGLPAAVVEKINNASKMVIQDPSALEELAKITMYPSFLPQEEFKKHLLDLDTEIYKFARSGDLIPSRMK